MNVGVKTKDTGHLSTMEGHIKDQPRRSLPSTSLSKMINCNARQIVT